MNIARRLVETARKMPDDIAVAQPLKSGNYRTVTFRELDTDSDRIAAALSKSGVKPGTKLALLVRYGIDFITLVFALYKTGAVLVLIDPGMGLRRMVGCLAEVEPDGFIALPLVHAVRIFSRRFPKAKYNLTVGRRWLWGGLSLDAIKEAGKEKNNSCSLFPTPFSLAETQPNDLAAIIFTSGSTGTAKGVAFTHRIFDTQVEEIRRRYEIRPGEIDLACFPFFGLFNAAMGVTTVIPDMDPTRPVLVDPQKIVDAANHWKITQSFASPALWNRVADYCLETGCRFETLKRAVSAGAPISFALLDKLKRCLPNDADIHTPYGATEALPIASISATEVLGETAEQTKQGGGVCVGKRFGQVQWKIIAITDDPIPRLEDARELPPGKIGELVVHGPQVTQRYVTRLEANALAKIIDANGEVWHRMGDVGYLDNADRFWFCGRKAHRVEIPILPTLSQGEREKQERELSGTLFSIPCEAIFNQHPKVFRSALVGVPEPMILVEPLPQYFPKTAAEKEQLLAEIRELAKTSPLTEGICRFGVHPKFPVDVRHNVKINRELLAETVSAVNTLTRAAKGPPKGGTEYRDKHGLD